MQPIDETIFTQSDADRLMPQLIEPGGGARIRITPRENIRLEYVIDEYCCNGHECGCMGAGGRNYFDRITRVTVTGDDQPLHPDWVRSLRDQCAAAGVEFVFLSWGDFVPCRDMAVAADAWAGKEPFLWVGRAHSGNLLDGVRHDATGANSATGQDEKGAEDGMANSGF